MPEVYASNEVKAELIDPISGSVLLSTEIPFRRDLTLSERPIYAQRGYHRSSTLCAANLRSLGSVTLRKDADSLALAAEIKRWQKGVVFYALSSDLKGQRYRHPHLRVTFTNADGSTDVLTAYNVKLSDRSLSAPDGGIVGDSISLDVLGGFEPKEGGYEPVRALDFARTGPATYLTPSGLTTAGDGVARITADGLLLEGAGKNLLANSGFEAGATTGWSIDSAGYAAIGTVTTPAGAFKTGNYAIRFLNSASNSRARQDFAVTAGNWYSVSGWCYVATFTSGLPGIRVVGATGGVDVNQYALANTGIIGSWQYVSTSFQANATGTVAVFLYSGSDNAAATNDLYFDCVQAEASPFPTSYIDNPSTSGTATRSPDLVGIVRPHNLLKWSEDFSRWATSNAAVTANSTTAPDGTATADTITSSGANGGAYLDSGIGGINGKTYTLSVWLKAASATTAKIWVTDNASQGFGKSVSVTTSWQRFYVTATFSSATSTLKGYIYANDGGTGSVYAWGAQLVEGSHPGPYVRTTDTPILPPASPALDPAWSQNGRVKFRVLPPPISTGKGYYLIGYGSPVDYISDVGLLRHPAYSASQDAADFIKTHDGSSGTAGLAGRGILSATGLYDGAPHDVELEWTNEINEQTGVREMWQRLYIDGALVASQDVAALYGATAWADIDPSRLISDGNVFAVLCGPSDGGVIIDWPTPRAGYRQVT